MLSFADTNSICNQVAAVGWVRLVWVKRKKFPIKVLLLRWRQSLHVLVRFTFKKGIPNFYRCVLRHTWIRLNKQTDSGAWFYRYSRHSLHQEAVFSFMHLAAVIQGCFCFSYVIGCRATQCFTWNKEMRVFPKNELLFPERASKGVWLCETGVSVFQSACDILEFLVFSENFLSANCVFARNSVLNKPGNKLD